MNSSSNTRLYLVDGRSESTLSVDDRGLAYGDGLFETMRFKSGFMPLWPYHWQRLAKGARVLGIPLQQTLVDRHLALALQQAADAGIGQGVVKLLVTRGSGGAGFLLPEEPQPTVVLVVWPYTPAAAGEPPAHLKTCGYQLSHNPALAGLKHLNRLEQVLAAKSVSLQPGQQGLVFDRDGNLIESLHHNIFLVKDRVLKTPDLSQCGVAGTLRRALLEQFAPTLRIEAQVAVLNQNDLSTADEVFICNAVRGIIPVHQWQKRRWTTGPVTTELQGCIAREWTNFYDC